MGSVIANIFANKELKDRILFTFLMFVIFRLGVHIPVPGVDASVIESLFTSGNLFGFLDLFSGGALSKFSIFAMSITPYINSSIIMQLLTAVIPTLEEWRKDGQEGYKRIQKVTRYFTVFLAAVQAFGMTYALRINNALVDNSWLYFTFVSRPHRWHLPPDVDRRKNYGIRNRQWHLADHLLRYRSPLPAGYLHRY